MGWATLSLAVLVGVVVIANKKNMNIGLVGMGAAMLLGTLAGLTHKEILSGFNTLLFLRMLGMQCLICVAKYNGTLEALSQRIIKMGCGRAIRLFPVFLFVTMLLCEYMGTALFLLMLPVLCALAFQLGMPVQKIVGIGLLTVWGGGMSPFDPPGVTLSSIASQAGCSVNQWNTAISGTIVASILFIIFYIVYGWYKEKPKDISNMKMSPLTLQHKLTLCGYAVFIFCNLVLGLDMAVTPVVIGIILCIIGVGDGKQLMKQLPWNSLFMVAGMTIMIGVVVSLGGISLISKGLAMASNKIIAPALLTAISGLMSVVSSAGGVVMPTLVPTVPDLVALMPGLSEQAMITAIGLGSYATALSPMSSVGANVLANYGTVYNPNEMEQKKEFNTLLLFALIGWVVFTLAGLLGLYGIQFVA